jgi:hypothetical protein
MGRGSMIAGVALATAGLFCLGASQIVRQASASPTLLVATTPADCHAVKFIAARGSGDNDVTSFGVIASKISAVLAQKARAAGVDYGAYGLPYTAVGIAVWKPTMSTAYWLSERQGRNMLRAYIKAQVHDCPGEKLVVEGYSQGAHVVGDVFSNGVGGLSRDDVTHVKAVALIADPRFNSREPFDSGSYRTGRNGILGARAPGDLNSVANRIKSWCRKDDIVCQGPGTTGNHAQAEYFSNYEGGIISFLAGRVGFADAGGKTATYPPGTRDLGFHSADGNVGCWIQRDASLTKYQKPPVLTARCVVHERNWTARWTDCRDISKIEYFYVAPTATIGTHEYGCTGGVPWNLDSTGSLDPWHAQPLNPGRSVNAVGFQCTATSAAEIRCTNTGGHGFAVGRTAFKLL